MKHWIATFFENTGKYRNWLGIILLVVLFSANKLHAQGPCDQISFSKEDYGPCEFGMSYTTQTDCYIELRFILTSGEFASYTVNSGDGFMVQQISPSELWVTHEFGFIPTGFHIPIFFTLPYDLNTSMSVAYLNDCAQLGCEIIGGWPIQSCPDPMDASIIGVKYRECGSLPYTNQTTIPGWPIQLLDADGNLIEEQLTDANGNYAFYDRPKGQYLVKEGGRMGWMPKVPANGQYSVNLAPSQQAVRNFGNCPECSEDDLYMDVVQLPGNNDTCSYAMNITNVGAYCFNLIDVNLTSGTFASATPSAGWQVMVIDSQHIQVKPIQGEIALGSYEPCKFQITGENTHDITLKVMHAAATGSATNPTANRSFSCPVLPSPPPCCPMGSTFGPELVCNPDFSLGNHCFSNDYNYFAPGGPTAIGSYSVLNFGQVNTANNQWACIDHTTYGSAGQMLIVDGYGGPVAWQQTVTVTAGTNYSFYAWFNNLVRPTKNHDDPQMALFVDNTQIAGPLNLSETPDQWVRLCGTWTAMASGPVVLSIRMLATTSIGNDVAIDDISFRRCVPSIGDLSGVVYRECGGMPYTNQPVLSDWAVQLLDTMGNLIAEQVTDAGGNYRFADRPLGYYIIKEIAAPGWTPNIPASGQYTVELVAGDSLVRDFGVCPLPGTISGVVYRECGGMSYTNQPVLSDWAVQLLDTMGNLIAEQVTDSAGNYRFGDRPRGIYIIKEVAAPGWTPNIPASGQYTVEINAGESLLRNFGVCPGCSCDSIEVIPYQVQSLSDTALYQLSVSNQSPYCFSYIQIALDTIGEIIGWDSLQPGWTVEQLNPKLLRLYWTEPQLPAGSFLPLLLKVNGAGEQKITTTTFWNDGMNNVPCSRGFQNPVPTPLSVCCIDPGPANLIPNGSFSSGNAFFSSDYNLNCNNLTVGRYCITTNPNAANSNFSACPDNTTGSGLMLVANGSLQSSKRIWYTTIPVLKNTDYQFIFHYTPVSNSNKPTFGVSINNFATSSFGVIFDVCSWLSMCVIKWNSGNNTSATLAIKDLTTNLTGNDFALDDMWFFPCPIPCQVSASITPINSCGLSSLQAIATGPGPISYKWCDNSTTATITQQLPCQPYTCTVTATCGNGSTATASVSANFSDQINPNAVCNPGTAFDMGNNCNLQITPAMIDGGSTDDCGIVSMTVTPAQVSCGTHPVTLTVKDACGNMSSCTTTIQAAEFIPPTAVCVPGMGIDLGTNCSVPITPAMIDGGSTDNCQIQSMSVSPSVLTGCGITTVTLTVTDQCGNTSTCSTGIQTLEVVSPIITTCPPNTIVYGSIDQNGLCTALFNPTLPVVTDNCDPSVTVTNNAPPVLQNGPNTIVWTATDDCGNETTCIQILTVECGCECGMFSDLFARPTVGAQSIPLACGGAYNFGCPNPGQSIPITGKFECQGTNCPATSQINWTLTQPNGNVINGAIVGPYFYLPILPFQYAQTGTYTLVLQGHCGATNCPPCVIQFTVDCPNPCPCDVPQFQKDVNKGFATALWPTTCKGCFSPIALNDCDMVEWKVNGGATLANTNGNQSFCHTFPGAGTYTVTMVVARKKSDGSLCEIFTFSKSVMVTCMLKDPCDDSVFPNSAFSEGAVVGGLNSGGASTGWKSLYGNPQVLEGQSGSSDGWAMLLSGHVDAADVMSHDTSRCLEKGSGVLTIRGSINTSRSNIKKIAVFFNRNESYVFNVFNSENCYRIAELDVSAYDSSWFDLEIPYDLSTWTSLDSCGDVPHGVYVRPIVYVTSPFESVQGGDGTRTCVAIDHICYGSRLVGIEDLPYRKMLRIAPNPNSGNFSVELPEPAKPGMSFHITDLTGRQIQQQKTEPGTSQQTVRAGELPAGLYFLQVVSDGKVLAIEKFVKQ